MKVMIVGAGKLGLKLAESLLNTNVDVTLVDTNARVIERINDHLDVLTVTANGIELEVLRELNIETYDLLTACTGSDETNVLICSLAKKLGCRRTIARIRNPEYTKQLSFIKAEMGIDHIVNPDLATANEMSRYLSRSYNLHSEDFAKGRVSMIDFNVSQVEGFVGKQLKDLSGLDNLLIVAVSREGEMLIPHGLTQLQENDIVHVMGESKRVNQLSERLGLTNGKKRVKKVMIFGGGKVGLYLAQQLRLANVGVTIVEQDRERCEYLAERLDDALIIHGDGTDINLLEEEDLQLMDAFVGASGFDEQNLLMCLLAKQSGVDKVIAKISRPNYVQVIDKLGVDVALNPTNITASDILRFIRGGRVVSVSLLLGGEAEVTEIIVGDNPSIIGKPLAELGLPKGIIIGAIVHNGQVIIPNGATVIHALDRLIIFCLTRDVGALDVFMKPSRRGGVLHELRNRNKSVGGSFKA
ncbi:MAG TPA: Trk system potassium transporter TrkA [Firmicutes bacterium]|nr:Trk system potassium transporter TrkA [Bacillota bacterium]